MTFDRTWIAFLAILPALWFGWMLWQRQANWRVLLKALAAVCALLALAEPSLEVYETKVAVGVLVDTSQSIPEASLRKAGEFVSSAESSRGRNEIRVLPFARQVRPLSAGEFAAGSGLSSTTGDQGRATDLESAIQQGLGLLPAGRIHRLVLLSDGKENSGSAARALWQARQLGVPIDTVVLPGQPRPNLRLETLSLPAEAYSGERFPVDLVLSAPESRTATIDLAAEGKSLGKSTVPLRPGSNQIRVYASIRAVGSVELSGTIESEGLGQASFGQALNLRKPRALVISEDPSEALGHLTATLQQADFDIEMAASLDPAQLERAQVAILNNQDIYAIPDPYQSRLEEFVQRGGGLLYIAGERSIYKEPTGAETPLERALPARIAPPRSPKGNCVVLIVDKSSSMEGRKMELARAASIGVIDNLRPIDMVGVLIFDNSFEWTVPIRRARNSSLIKRLVSGITPDGGTQIAPALEEAYRRTLPVQAVVKHIVLLTDGISEEGNSIAVSREAGENKITISTIGLGQDVNRAYLEKIANLSGGKSYFLTDPSALQQILLRDVMEYTGTTAIEREIRASVSREAEILKGVNAATAPPLEGYVKFEAKTAAERILDVAEEDDPLLVRWQYGLGRSVVFTSDAKSRWAAKWVGWPGFDTLWANISRDLLPHARPGEATVRYDSASDELVVDYRLAPYAQAPATVPDIFVIGPDEFSRALEIRKVAQGAYQGRVKIDNRRGLFRIRPLREYEAFPEVGIYRQEPELTDYGSNETLMAQIATFTGGIAGPTPQQIFRTDGRAIPATMQLWPLFLTLAILLTFAEVITRKWGAVRSLFERSPREATA